MPPNVNSTTLKRIHREIADLKKEDLGPIKLSPSDDDLFHWNATIPGPEGSVYEGGVYNVEIVLAHDYPFSAPRVTFRTRIYHMNINERGSICIDILKHNWSPALSLFKVILSLSSLLTDPNPKDPLVPQIATEYVRNRVQHDREARRWTELYARPSTVTTKDKGKGKAPAPPATGPSHTHNGYTRTTATGRANPHPSTADAVITIEDSDDETPAPARSRRTRAPAAPASGTRASKRKRDQVDIDLSAGDAADVQRSTRRRRGAGSARIEQDPGDVIVIEDED
ncbi:ubiquitin-conjugating enzyme/RWD-like protein [Fomes fomentarius]|nr:ubiquitin-conjugating enzyme/RWD-like protein [Fomes fomentarius]